ncbi:MAG: diguanylate cyclase [Chloroflexus sp.]
MHTIIQQERHRFDTQRRRTYQIAGLLGILMVSIDVVGQFLDQSRPFWVRLIYIMNDLFLIGVSVVLIWMLATRRSQLLAIERLTFVIFAAESLLFNGIIPPLIGQDLIQLQEQTIHDDIWFLLMICTMGFLLFRHRTGLLIVTGLYSLSVAIVVGQVLLGSMRGDALTPGLQALQVYGMGALFLCFIYIISRYRAQAQRLQVEYEVVESLAFVDMLTNVANRRRCEQVLQEAIARSQRYHEPFTICLWDVDHFKQINDTHGHTVGDQVLSRLAQIAQHTPRN